jgi:hypothetical protein
MESSGSELCPVRALVLTAMDLQVADAARNELTSSGTISLSRRDLLPELELDSTGCGYGPTVLGVLFCYQWGY